MTRHRASNKMKRLVRKNALRNLEADGRMRVCGVAVSRELERDATERNDHITQQTP